MTSAIAEIGSAYLDRFTLIKELGRGTYGKVYEAEDLFDGGRVAVKISEFKGCDGRKVRNTNEALILEALKGIESPYRRLVVDLKMSVVLEDCVVLVLELLSHGLTDSIWMGEVSDLQKLSVLSKQMVEFLCFMSQAEAIHGDIKPENILHELEVDGIKFTDFGLSYCPLFEEKIENIQSPGYMAPELIMKLDYDASADVWSVGCVLVECLTKTRLFRTADRLEMLECVAKIIGVPDKHMIKRSPMRKKLFFYDDESKRWIVKARGYVPSTPMGMTAYLEQRHNVHVADARCKLFIDLVEGMLRLNPRDRYTPQECLEHPFIALSNDWPTSIINKKLKRICSEMDLSSDSIGEAEILFQEVKNDWTLSGRNDLEVMISCLYIVCCRKKAKKSYKKLVSVVGDVDLRHFDETIGLITSIKKTRGSIDRYCASLGLDSSVARKAERASERATARKIVSGSTKASVRAAALFIAAFEKKIKVSLGALGRVTGAPVASIKSCLKRMVPLSMYLLA